MSDDQARTIHERLDRIEQTNTRFIDGIARVERALVGEPSLGNRGLVHRVDLVEDKVEKHDRKLLVWGSLIAAIGTAASFAKDWIR